MDRFWGVHVEPNKAYTQDLAYPLRLHRAVLGSEAKSPDHRVILYVVFEENKRLAICSLRGRQCEQVELHTAFKQNDKITLFIEGSCSVHLTGEYEFEPTFMSDEYDSEDEDTLSSQLEESFSDVLSNESSEEESQPLNIKLPAKRKPNHEPSPSKKHHAQEKQEKAGNADRDVVETAAVSTTKQKQQQSPKETPSKPSNAAQTPNKKQNKPKKRVLKGGVIVADDHLGTGEVAQVGNKVTVKYTGRLSSGKVFDKGSVAFVIGRGEVIPGWDIGIPGMRIGGRRKLTVPPKMGYGSAKSGPIPANSTLEFDVELSSVTSGKKQKKRRKKN